MRRISIEEAQAGQVVGRPILSESGDLLLARGVELTDRYIESLRFKGYSSLVIQDALTHGIDVPEIISSEVRSATMRKLGATFGSFHQAAGELRGQTTSQITRALGSRTFAREADKIDPYRAMIDEVRMMLDDLLTVEVLDGLNAIKLHDDALLQHSIDVTVVAMLLGRQLQLENRELRMLGLGCLMHDIGKTLIEPAIIRKPGPLSRSEWAKMQSHPQLGYMMLRASASPHDLFAHHVAYQHHEHQDGGGYPRGLRGTNRVRRSRRMRYDEGQLLLIAEIAAAANVYEALSSHRPYRPAFPHEKIAGVLREVAGTVLNAELVEQLIRVLPSIPTGASIEVVSGRYEGYRGVVARIDRQHLQRPWIRLTHDRDGRPVRMADIDLLDHEDIQIRSVMIDTASAPGAVAVAV